MQTTHTSTLAPRAGRFPDFLCIGAQKAGTTWLHAQLARHPGIWTPRVKELQYFNELYLPGRKSWTPRHRGEDATRALTAHIGKQKPAGVDWSLVAQLAHTADATTSDAWYGGIFAFAPAGRIVGEMTPDYALLPPEGIQHVLRLNPKVKIVFIARDMIDRAWSQMRMLFARRSKPPTESELVKMAASPDVLARSQYAASLSRWFDAVPQNQILVLSYELVKSDPQLLLDRLCGFFDVPPRQIRPADLAQKIHAGETHELPGSVYETLKSELRPEYDAPHASLAEHVAHWRARHGFS